MSQFIDIWASFTPYWLLSTELVLYMLLEKFIFEPGPEINWQLSTIQHPIVIGSGSDKAQVPMKVLRVIN